MDIAAHFEELDRVSSHEDYDSDDTTSHEPTSEPVPHLKQYTYAFAEAERLIRRLVRNVHDHILREEEQDAESAYMAERTISVESPAYSPPYVVGISGNSGIGKSTLINATLGLLSLCPTVGFTQSCLQR